MARPRYTTARSAWYCATPPASRWCTKPRPYTRTYGPATLPSTACCSTRHSRAFHARPRGRASCAPNSCHNPETPPTMDQATRIIAIRHGETAWNVDTRIQGHLDIPLNDTGLWQARQLGHALAEEPVAAIYSSDLQRAYATAQAVAETTGAPLRPERGLRERSEERRVGKECRSRW